MKCLRFGKHRNGLQRFRCPECGKTYTEGHDKPLNGMTIPLEKALPVLHLLVEGASVRSAERITGLHRDTILRQSGARWREVRANHGPAHRQRSRPRRAGG